MGFPPLREELRGLEPYGAPQRSTCPVAAQHQREPLRPVGGRASPTSPPRCAAAATTLNRYPDREFVELRTALAAYLPRHGDRGCSVEPEQVWAANGSNEVMLQLLQAFGGPGRTALSFAPTYSMYPEYARDTATGWVAGAARGRLHPRPRRAPATLVRERPPARGAAALAQQPHRHRAAARGGRGAVRARSASPAGWWSSTRRTASSAAPARPSALELLAEHRNLVVTRTMSKAFALAGARVGYLAADPAICDAIRVVRLPYHLSAVTQAVALAALRHAAELLGRVDDAARRARPHRRPGCASRGCEVADSDANFALFGRFADRHAVWQGLLERGVLIRETGPDGWLRVSIGTPAEMTAFRAALAEVLTDRGHEGAE